MPPSAEVESFLAHSMVAQVATLSPKGRPFVTPLWFVVDGGRLYMTTGRDARAARNVVQHSEAVLLFTGEQLGAAGRVLRMRGTVSVHAGFPRLRILLRFARKYYLTPRGLATELRHARQWRLRQRYYAQGSPAYLEVLPGTTEFLARSA